MIVSGNDNYVIKENNNNIKDIFNYLSSRDFNNYPNIISNDRNNIKYEYILDNDIYNPHKGEDLITLVSLLHSKTSYKKEVREDTYKEIYENIKNNLLYLQDYYNNIYSSFIKSIYSSPKEYMFLKSFSKINASINFSLNELDNWYQLVKNNNSQRLSLNHNNLSLDHYIKNDKDYLISWDNAKFDTPVLDLYKLYLNNFWDLEFDTIYKKYLSINNLSLDEQKLFFILISMPPSIDFNGSEFNVCKRLRKKLDYIYKTEEFLKPYYST